MKKSKPVEGISYPQFYMNSVYYVKPLWMLNFEQFAKFTFYIYKSGSLYYIAEVTSGLEICTPCTNQKEIFKLAKENIVKYIDKIPSIIEKRISKHGELLKPKYN